MTERKNIDTGLADTKQVEELAAELNTRQFPRIVAFADVVSKYVETRLVKKVSWLEVHAVAVLVMFGGSMTIGALGQRMLRSSHSMTRLVDNLQKKGLIRRYRTMKDRRAIHVRLTSRGLAFMKQYLDDIDLVEEEVMSSFNKNEIETLMRLMQKVRFKLVGPPPDSLPGTLRSKLLKKRP